MKSIFVFCFALTSLYVTAQDSTSTKPSPALTFSGYAEVYYSYDLNKPASNNRTSFFYSHNRHNEFNINLGFAKAAYNTQNIRANLAIGTGTYMNANYAAEPGTLKNIYEANAGVRLSKKNDLWLDAGIFSSHIGFESAIGKDCWALTRSLAADNSPYFESGAKLTYNTPNGKWLLSALVFNGWQRIQRVDGNSLLSFGTQVQYKPSQNIMLNYSNFIGSDKPDSTRQMRYFQNFYGIFSITKKFGITTGVDVGLEQRSKGSRVMNTWYTPVIIARYLPADKWAIALRGEYYSDPHNVIISGGTNNGFKTAGFSANIGYSPVTNAVIRFEARTLKSKDAMFTKENDLSRSNTFFTTSIAVNF